MEKFWIKLLHLKFVETNLKVQLKLFLQKNKKRNKVYLRENLQKNILTLLRLAMHKKGLDVIQAKKRNEKPLTHKSFVKRKP